MRGNFIVSISVMLISHNVALIIANNLGKKFFGDWRAFAIEICQNLDLFL